MCLCVVRPFDARDSTMLKSITEENYVYVLLHSKIRMKILLAI